MIYQYNNKKYNTNLAGDSFEQLQNGIWKFCLISDNDGITDKNTDYYETVEINNHDQKESKRCLKNKIFVNMMDGTRDKLHIIHWNPSNGYFCVTTNSFWNQLD